MKKLFLTVSLILSVQFLFSQGGNGWTLECGGYSFKVWDDDTPIGYSFKSGDRISRNYSGKVTSVGNIYISYNYSGEVTQIGNVYISRNYSGKITQIGGMYLSFDYSGNFTGSSGSIDCDW